MAQRPSATAEMSAARLGALLSAAAVVVAVVAALFSPALWPWLAVVAAALVFVVAAFQTGSWRRVSADPESATGPRAKLSFWLHVVSWVAVLVGMYALMTVLVASGFSDGRWVLALTGLVVLVLGQTLGATRFLRTDGPAGTIPGHVERLRDLANSRVSAPDDLDPEDDGDGDDGDGDDKQR